jgi:hypothetical protein
VDAATADSRPATGHASPAGEADGPWLHNAVRDAIDQLPLAIIPLETRSLRRARLIKNMQLDGVVEVFSGEGIGSGQLAPDQLAQHFHWKDKTNHPDLQTIRRLAALNSYDVYSLRIELRRLGISISDLGALHLSEEKAQELTHYMKTFTEPLMRQVYGGANSEVQDFDELIAMFERPNKAEALRNLRKIAERLQIELIEVPRFLEDYGDVFLSLAYFKEHLDNLVPRISAFLDGAKGMQSNFQLRNDPRFMSSCAYLDERLSAIITSITGRFESFNQHTAHMWHNITAESFRKVRDLITAHHTTVGGVLCGLSVKMRHWDQRFGKLKGDGAILSRAEFITSEMRQGIEKIQRIEESAPKIADLN